MSFLLPEGAKVKSATHPFVGNGRLVRLRLTSARREDVAFALTLAR